MRATSAASRKIADITGVIDGVIDGIAFQTNILVLNAAVEAARAGEQVRGFAVLVSEVRNLSQRSAAAVKEIKPLIADSVVRVDARSMPGRCRVDASSLLVGQAGATMGSVLDSIGQVAAMVAATVAEIRAANGEQSIGLDQVNEAGSPAGGDGQGFQMPCRGAAGAAAPQGDTGATSTHGRALRRARGLRARAAGKL